MKETRKRPIILTIGFLIIFFAGILIIFSSFEIINNQRIMDNQKQIIDENKQWAEKITFWEVTGGLGEDIIEGERIYYEALAKYSTALQEQTMAILSIIGLSIVIAIILGVIIVKIV